MAKVLFVFVFAAFQVFSTGIAANGYEVKLSESIGGEEVVDGNTGIEFVGDYIAKMYKYGASLIGLVCVLVIAMSGVQIIAGGANPEGVTQAKTRIFQAILSLVLLLGSALILKTVNPGFFVMT